MDVATVPLSAVIRSLPKEYAAELPRTEMVIARARDRIREVLSPYPRVLRAGSLGDPAGQLRPGPYAELPEHLAQVILDCARADE